MLPVYLSYRTQDAHYATRIIERCHQVYGLYSVQHDPLRSCPTGTRIERHVENLIAACRQVIIVIGKDWAGLDEYGRYRLSTADMPVRAEVLAALQSDREIIVMLVDDAGLPDPQVIPEEMQALFEQPVMVLHPATFDRDLDPLFPAPSRKDRILSWFVERLMRFAPESRR
jgi:hypothetical protein